MRFALSLMLLAVMAGVFLFDSVATFRGNDNDSVSRTLLDWSRQWPIIPMMVGVVIGHLFRPQ